MFRSFLTVIIIVCATRIVFASSRHKSCTSICGENEVLSQCVNRVCSYRKCSEVGGPIECIMRSPHHCKKGCICRDKYLRADNGTCILASQCPNALKCPKLNEYYDPCPPQCPSRTCAVMDNTTTCPEPLQVGDPRCPPGSCRCNVGFYRHSNGNCVTWNLCNICRENENVTSCFEGRCERRNCSDLGKPVACVRIDPIFCTVGCLCQDGFLRANNGTCIPVNQCPEAQCGDNEDFDICPPTCPGEQCGVDPSTVLCLPSPEPGDPSCQPSCRCRTGYLRNENGTCIPQNQCPTECGANEVYDTCIAPCPRRICGDVDSHNRCAEPPQPGDPACTAGCRCVDNFFRNNEGNCVPRSECNQSPRQPDRRPTRRPPPKY